jgi:hypothetical protein
MDILFRIHSDTRWLVVLVGVVALVKFLIGWLGKGKFQKFDRILTSAFSGLVDLQVLLGLVFLIWSGLAGVGFPRQRLEHAFIMIIAAVVAHLPSRWKSLGDTKRFRNSFLAVLGVGVLIFLGVVLLPGGMVRWQF